MRNSKRISSFVESYMRSEGCVISTQEIIDSKMVPRLKNYQVRPGKVSDSIFGGKGSYVDKATGKSVEFENPPLKDRYGTSLRIMVRTEKISTHDIVRGNIPFKDQVLAVNHDYMRKMLRSVLGSSQLEVDGLGRNAVVICC